MNALVTSPPPQLSCSCAEAGAHWPKALGMFVVMAVLYVPWRAMLWVGSFFFTIPAAQLGASCPGEPLRVRAPCL
jgi:hypothetical protein